MLMFIDGECGDLKVVLDGGYSSLVEIKPERGIQKFYKPTYIHSVTNAIDEIEVSMIFLRVKFFVGS